MSAERSDGWWLSSARGSVVHYVSAGSPTCRRVVLHRDARRVALAKELHRRCSRCLTALADARSEASVADLSPTERREPAVNCCNPDHWFDEIVGWPGKHDGGLPDFPKTPCITFEKEYGDERRSY